MRRSPSPIAARAGLLAALLGGLTLACAQGDIAGPEQLALQASVSTLQSEFTKCARLPATSVSKYVSPGVWDTLRVGPHKLIFQPKSLSQRTLITAATYGDSTRSIKFGPDGLKFQTGYSPTLVMNVGNCGVLASTTAIVFTDDWMTSVKETRASRLNLTLNTVSAAITHFSRYAVHH